MRTLRIAMLVLALCLASAAIAQATVWDPAAQWSLASNPNGVWTYGYFDLDLTTFSTNVGAEDRGAVQVWVGVAPSDAGLIYNPGGDVVAGIDPYGASLHPGSDGTKPTYRWTAPEDLQVAVDALYYDATGATTTDVHVFLNGTALFDGDITGGGSTQQYAGILNVNAGDNIDFTVGWGNGSFVSDLTGLNATITQVPEPCTMLALFAGIGGLIARRRRA